MFLDIIKLIVGLLSGAVAVAMIPVLFSNDVKSSDDRLFIGVFILVCGSLSFVALRSLDRKRNKQRLLKRYKNYTSVRKKKYSVLEQKIGWRLAKMGFFLLSAVYVLFSFDTDYDEDIYTAFLSRSILVIILYFILKRMALYIYYGGKKPKAVMYKDDIIEKIPSSASNDTEDVMHTKNSQLEQLVKEATSIIRHEGKASTALLQRRMKIGYSTAANIMEELEITGVVGKADGATPRKVF